MTIHNIWDIYLLVGFFFVHAKLSSNQLWITPFQTIRIPFGIIFFTFYSYSLIHSFFITYIIRCRTTTSHHSAFRVCIRVQYYTSTPHFTNNIFWFFCLFSSLLILSLSWVERIFFILLHLFSVCPFVLTIRICSLKAWETRAFVNKNLFSLLYFFSLRYLLFVITTTTTTTSTIHVVCESMSLSGFDFRVGLLGLFILNFLIQTTTRYLWHYHECIFVCWLVGWRMEDGNLMLFFQR